MVYHPTSSKSFHSCIATQFLGHSTATDYRDSLPMSAVTTAASSPSTEPGDNPWRNSWICLYLLATPAMIKGSAHVPRSVWRVSRLQPVGATAVEQSADINKVTYTQDYQSAMSPLVIEFTILEGRDGEILVKDLAVVDSHSNRVSSYVFKWPYSCNEVTLFNALTNQAIDHGCNWNDGDILYWELETVLHREASLAVAIYCFGPQKHNLLAVF